MPSYKPDQRNVSSAGEKPQIHREGASPNGAYSGMLKRQKLIDGEFVTVDGMPKDGRTPKPSVNHVGHHRRLR